MIDVRAAGRSFIAVIFAIPLSHAAAFATKPVEANVVNVIAHDFALEIPASIPAGLTTFRLLDRGKQEHHLTVMRLDDGKTAAEALSAIIKAGRGPRPAWLHPVGGPNSAPPGGETRATLILQPGNYLAFCEVPGPDPAPHFMKGMVKAFVVSSPARPAKLPSADLTIRMTDYDFVLDHALTRGHHSIAVTNAASQSHMLVMNRFPTGHAAGHLTDEFVAWANDPQGKPGPGEAAGGVTEISPGTTVVMDGDFAPGTYLLICFVPDATDGKPHFLHGMQKEIVVR